MPANTENTSAIREIYDLLLKKAADQKAATAAQAQQGGNNGNLETLPRR